MTGPEVDALARRADALLQIGRHEQAEAAARQALVAEPEHSPALYCLARSLAGQKRNAEALEAVDQYLIQRPDSEWGYRQRALVLRSMNSRKESVAAACEAVRLAPESSETHRVAAMCYLDVNSFAKALEHADLAVSLRPDSALAWFVRAQVSEAAGADGAAEDHYREVLRLDPQNGSAVNNLGRLKARRGDVRGASELFDQAARLDATSSVARKNLTLMATQRVRLGGESRALAGLLWMAGALLGVEAVVNVLVGRFQVALGFGVVLALLALATTVARRIRMRRLDPVARELLVDLSPRERVSQALRTSVSLYWAVAAIVVFAAMVGKGNSPADALTVAPWGGLFIASWTVRLVGSPKQIRQRLVRRGWWPAAR
jgi:tetratricopeptide (TPR) repeat protein